MTLSELYDIIQKAVDKGYGGATVKVETDDGNMFDGQDVLGLRVAEDYMGSKNSEQRVFIIES